VASTKRTAVVPQVPIYGSDVGAIDDPERATMASALIFLHVAILPIDRTLAVAAMKQIGFEVIVGVAALAVLRLNARWPAHRPTI
jgi:hypothetical protein